MRNGLNFLAAAKRCEIAELTQLGVTSTLVDRIGRLVHALQRERGLSNLFIGSGGSCFVDPLREQITVCEGLQAQLLARFEALDTDPDQLGCGSRLCSRIAHAMQGLDGLPALRERVQGLGWSPTQATAAYSRLIAALLTVVFEAADSATDPQVSRVLVAMFNFMQGKEFAGQERAIGVAVFARGRTEPSDQQAIVHLIDAQERCFRLFGEFCSDALLTDWQAEHSSATAAELERLRRIACTLPADSATDPTMGRQWYDCCTRRIDRMRELEDRLAADLRQRCAAAIAQAKAELDDFIRLQRAMLERPSQTVSPTSLAFFDDTAPVGEAIGVYGRRLERSILELVLDQSQRLQAISTELEGVRASLNERKIVERAKGLLMARSQLSEDQAYKTLRQTAMNQGRRITDVAQSVLLLADILPEAPR